VNPACQAVPDQHVANQPPVRSPGLVIGKPLEQVQCWPGDSSWSFGRGEGPRLTDRQGSRRTGAPIVVEISSRSCSCR
jgi:hypothetical protein